MILPYVNNNSPIRKPVATLLLLGATVLMSACVWIYDRSNGTGLTNPGDSSAITWFGIVPAHFNPLNLLTYSLVHTGIGHLFVNAFYLWVFGTGLEMALDRRTYILLYYAGGIVGGLLQWLVTLLVLNSVASNTPIVGASAACFTLIGLYAVRYYRAVIHFVGLPFKAHVVYVVAAFLLYEILAGLVTLLQGNASDGIAHWAHIGGFVFGLACAQAMHLAEAGERAYLTEDASLAMDKTVPGAAIEKWELLLAREPDNAEARLELARSWMMMGDSDQATIEYTDSLTRFLDGDQVTDAAMIYAELRELDLKLVGLPALSLFLLATGLIDLELYPLANEPLRTIYLEHPASEEAEMALLESAALCIHHLNRCDEARFALRLYQERHAESQLRALADDLGQVLERAATSRAASRSAAQIMATIATTEETA